MNAAKANIPYYGSYTERDPVRVAQDGVELFKEEGFDVIIVDTSGRHSQEAALFEEMEQISLAVNPDEIIFVLDGSIGQAAFDQAQAFGKTVDIGSVIITKLDQQNSKGGGALSAVAATSSPITHIGTGEHITDFEKFEPQRFVTKLLGGGDIGGLMEAMSNIDMKEQKEAVDSIMAGKFSLRIMRDQFQNLLSLGPLDQVMGMIPGLSQMLPKGSEELSSARIKRTMTIMDSMTEEELDAPDLKIFSDSRIRRIAQGAGVHPAHIQELFQMYKPFKDALSKLPKMRGGRGGGPGNMRQLNEMMSALNPQAAAMMKQMGGPNMLQNMMKQMQQMGMGGKGGKGGFPMGFDPKMFGM